MFQHAVKLQMPLKHLTSSMKIVWRTLVAKFYSVSPHKWNSDFFWGGVMTWSCMLRQAGFFLNVLSWTISGSNLVDRAVTMSESLLSEEETDQFLGESWKCTWTICLKNEPRTTKDATRCWDLVRSWRSAGRFLHGPWLVGDMWGLKIAWMLPLAMRHGGATSPKRRCHPHIRPTSPEITHALTLKRWLWHAKNFLVLFPALICGVSIFSRCTPRSAASRHYHTCRSTCLSLSCAQYLMSLNTLDIVRGCVSTWGSGLFPQHRILILINRLKKILIWLWNQNLRLIS